MTGSGRGGLRGGYLPSQRHADFKRTALLLTGAGHRDPTPMQLNQLPGERQADAQSRSSTAFAVRDIEYGVVCLARSSHLYATRARSVSDSIVE